MNKFPSIMFNTFFVLCCTVLITMMLPTSPSFALAADASSSSSLISVPQSIRRKPSSLQLPTRSDVIAALIHQHDNNYSRNLQQEQNGTANKFSSLNEVLYTIELKLPDAETSGLTITEIVCRELNVDDIQLTHSIPTNTTQRISVDVTGVDISCTFNWQYQLAFLSGGGTGEAWTEPTGSSISVDVDFISEDYSTAPPNDVVVSNCNTIFQIKDTKFEDGGMGITSLIANTLEGLLRDTIEKELSGLVCDEIEGLAEEGEALDDLLIMLSDRIDSYLVSDALQEYNDPLSAEKNAQVPMDDEGNPMWINFQEMQDFLQELLGVELDELAQSLMGDGDSLAINTFVRNSILNEDGLMVIDPSVIIDDNTTFFEMHDMFTQTTMSVQSISIKGLDSFQETDILNPIGNYTLQNSFKLEYLTFLLEVEVVIQASSKSNAVISSTADATPIQETFTIEITANDVDVQFSLFLGVNNQTLGSMPLGSIIHVKNILPCALSLVDDAEVTELAVSVSNVTSPTLSGFLDAGTDHLITTGADAFYSMYEQVLFQAMPKFFAMSIRDMLNDYIEDALNDEDACPEPDNSMDSLMDYRDLLLPEDEAVEMLGRGGSPYGELFRGLYGFLDEILSSVDENGLSWLNSLLVLLLGLDSNKEGGIVFAGDLISQSLEISLNGLNAAVEIGVSDVTVSNLDSLGALQLFQPMHGESSVVNNTASVGVGPEPLRLSFTVLVKGKGDQLEVHNEVELGISLSDVLIMLEVLAQMEEPPFLNFPLEDVTNLQCWMSTIVTPVLDQYGIRVGEPDSGLVLRKLAVTIAEARLDMTCISCSSPMMLELEQTMQTPEGIKDTTEVANKLVDYGTSLLGGDYVQHEIDKMLNAAAYNCPHSPSYQENFSGIEYEELKPVESTDNSNGFLIAIVVVIAVVAVVATIIFFFTRWLTRRRHNRWLNTLNKHQIQDLEMMELDEKELEKDLNTRMKSLVTSKEVPWFVRLSMPIVILGNIALFLSGHLSLGGTVNISGNIFSQEFNIEGFFEFSMAKSMIEMWEAGAKALAVMIAIFSGVWPYTKLLFTLFIWLAPLKWLSSKRRGKILHWLDLLGKWSMVDVFVLLMTLASFQISVESPDLAFLPSDLYSINMLVVPQWGLYANMLAQLVAQITSHVVIHYHRKTVRAATKFQAIDLDLAPPPNSGDTQEKLCTHRFKLDYEASTRRAILRKRIGWVLLAVLLSFIVLVICGCSLPSFNIEILGIVGLAVESGNEFKEAKTYYSVFDLAHMIMEQARYINKVPDTIGLGTLASLLVITVFIVPLAQAASLLAQWFAPMSRRQRSINTVFNEMLSAWQYMEVYVLSIIIAAWQLGGVSEFMLNAYCDPLEETFQFLSYFGILKNDDAQCFRVDATVETASWLLVAASLILCILNHFIGAAARQKKQDDDTPAERRLHTDRWPQSPKPSESALGVDSVNQMGEAEGASSLDNEKHNVSPISPRFTDYYYFATTHRTEDQDLDLSIENEDAETAVLTRGENNGEMHQVVINYSEVPPIAPPPGDSSSS